MRHLVVCCDGTWNSAEENQHGVPTPTNVRLFHNALAEKDGLGEPGHGDQRGATVVEDRPLTRYDERARLGIGQPGGNPRVVCAPFADAVELGSGEGV